MQMLTILQGSFCLDFHGHYDNKKNIFCRPGKGKYIFFPNAKMENFIIVNEYLIFYLRSNKVLLIHG